jgi:DNA-binding transcriptional regulator YbjK
LCGYGGKLAQLCYQRLVPKVVDVAQRRAELAEAVWRVIRREGLQRVSVRNVAREAGSSMGALRYYFATQDDLLGFAMQLVMERARARVLEVRHAGPDPHSRAMAMIEEVLPLDPERLAEAQVWLALTARSLVDPALAELRDKCYGDLQHLCQVAVTTLLENGRTPEEKNLRLEVERLYALIDGLALHVVTRPAAMDPRWVRTVLAHHLDSLVGRDDAR